jgi:spermidine/putrescine transport system permease protein
LRWWISGSGALIHNSVYTQAVTQSFKLALLCTVIVVPLGVGLAIVLGRWHGRGSGSVGMLTVLPLVMPELILAIALFLLITEVLTVVHFGTVGQLIGQITFILPFVVVIVRGRLVSIGGDLEQAAMDLGATPFHALRLVLLPLIQPAVVASAIVAFALSIDDFIVTQWLSSDASSQTVPMLIYNTARGSATPALNAAAAVLAIGTIVVVGIGAGIYLALARRRGLRAA